MKYQYGNPNNNPVLELAVCFELMRPFILSDDTKHPSCQKLIADAKKLIQQIINQK